ncbi:MAG TPA: T9SS type A sorting domain-containing protein [Saprospiraceae bacterium]|nr:T9SS type A sorting domain-containing protein [Saprospiraceae bacterium]HMQ84437.1 T9SS type A sorting domain-containing protein [Saprospiraceae bacterium]
MKKYIAFAFACLSLKTFGQTIWNGPSTLFEKEVFADWTLPENQDRITDSVWITRANSQGIFNIAQESAYIPMQSPSGTAWAYGTTAEWATLNFQPWELAVEGNPPAMVNQDMVLHLQEEDIYIDIRFLSWTAHNQGGGFSYRRSTPPTNAVNSIDISGSVILFPNPSSSVIQFKGLSAWHQLFVYDLYGKQILQVEFLGEQSIDIRFLPKGMYCLQVPGVRTFRFWKY